jgi:small subunit ribosomal protein S7
MSRRGSRKKGIYSSDPVYQSVLVHMFVTRIMRNGKKSLAYRILYSAFRRIQDKSQREPLAIMEQAVRVVTPTVQLKSRRVGGATYQIPTEVSPSRGIAIAIRWIFISSYSRPGRNIDNRLSIEIIDAACGIGNAVRKREEIYRMAEANKAFTRYRFSKFSLYLIIEFIFSFPFRYLWHVMHLNVQNLM